MASLPPGSTKAFHKLTEKGCCWFQLSRRRSQHRQTGHKHLIVAAKCFCKPGCHSSFTMRGGRVMHRVFLGSQGNGICESCARSCAPKCGHILGMQSRVKQHCTTAGGSLVLQPDFRFSPHAHAQVQYAHCCTLGMHGPLLEVAEATSNYPRIGHFICLHRSEHSLLHLQRYSLPHL